MSLWSVGRHWVSSLTFNGIVYNYYVAVSDEAARVWSPQISKGDWQGTNPEVIAGYMMSNAKKTITPESLVAEGIAYMNNQLTSYFGSIPPPVQSWEEKMESLLAALVLYIKDNVPQIK